MNNVLRIVLFALCFLVAQSIGSAQSPVWKVSKDGQSLYLGGTCHLLRKSDFPLPVAFDAAYGNADILVPEVDPQQMEDPSVVMTLMGKARFTDGRTLKTVLSKEVYEELAEQGQKSGLPIEILNGFKPGMAVTMITIQELIKVGVSQEGVDMFYAKKGKADGKPIRALESVQFQIDLITSIGEGFEDEFVRYSLRDLHQIEAFFDEMIRAWREGDNEALERLFVKDMRQFPKLYESLLVERNRKWMQQLEPMLATSDVEFVLVGAGHLVGKDGLLHYFKEMGCEVVAMNSAAAPAAK